MWRVRQFFRWLKWLWDGKPVITYPGYSCGCCGDWTWEEFTIPTYKSQGEWWDTWGLCPGECRSWNTLSDEALRNFEKEV